MKLKKSRKHENTINGRRNRTFKFRCKIKNKLSKNVKEIAIPKLNFVISSYYKGTGLEEVLKN